MPHQPSQPPAVLVARQITHDRGGRTVLRDVSLTVGPGDRVGVIGPNGAGKSTLLQILAGLLHPDEGSVEHDPPTASVGYLAQEQRHERGESVFELLRRRCGVAKLDDNLAGAAARLAAGEASAGRDYDDALARFLHQDVAGFASRAAVVLDDLGVSELVDRDASELSGGQEAKIALAAIELARHEVMLLDEPTNDLDFAGLQRLENWVLGRSGALVVVSHDRAFLERTVTHVLDIDDTTHRASVYSGGWTGYLAERANAQRRAREAYEVYDERRRELVERARTQREWASAGVRKEKKNPRDHDTAQRDFRINRTEQLAHRARQSERALENLDVVDKPFEGWTLHFSIASGARAGAVVVRVRDGVLRRGDFQFGPLNLEIGWGERVALRGPNGAGKTTLVKVLLGDLTLSSGSRWMGPSVITGVLGQDRRLLTGDGDLVTHVQHACAASMSATRSLLAKFGLGPEHVSRPTRLLSPGERTRGELAIFQGRGVNFLVLDEPTNHLDLAAIEQVESALGSFEGTLLVVSHDRRLLDALDLTRRLDLDEGRLREVD